MFILLLLLCLAVVRKEYQAIDLNEGDVNEEGAIASIMDVESGETIDDLRIPVGLDEVGAEYKGLREAIKENSSGSGKDVFVTVLEAMGKRKILSAFMCK